MRPPLETTGLSKRYGHLWALRDCTLALPAGRVAALVGPNGAGKSSLMHLAVGLIRPDSGTIRVLGGPVANNTEVLARVGFVAQETPLFRDFKVSEMLALGAHLNPRFDAAHARGRLKALGIPLDRRTRELSGGQRAQVALTLALAKRPELLLLDEPVASLDPLARREFLQTLMGAVAEDGTTVLLSSHLVGDLERVCDYLIVLHSARVQVAGDVDALLAEHRVLIGPAQEPSKMDRIAGVAAVVQESHLEKQTTLMVRANAPILDPKWTVSEVTLEDMVLAYLANSGAGHLPGPSRMQTGVRA